MRQRTNNSRIGGGGRILFKVLFCFVFYQKFLGEDTLTASQSKGLVSQEIRSNSRWRREPWNAAVAAAGLDESIPVPRKKGISIDCRVLLSFSS